MTSVKISAKILFDLYYREENKHFLESLSQQEEKNTQLFICKLKQHALYHLVVLNCEGKKSLINKWLYDYVEENCNYKSDSDEELEDKEK